MIKNAEAYFMEYEQVVRQVDKAFSDVQNRYGDKVKCAIKCADCCYALFDLSLIEAMYLKDHLDMKVKPGKRALIIRKANKADRETCKIKRRANKELKNGKEEAEIMIRMALEKVRCPLLNDENQCDLYEYRPITCRVYGIPTAISGRGHTCGMSGFIEGKKYPTANLDVIHKKLYRISAEYAKSIKSRYSKLAELLVPVSMAFLTEYDDKYLGVAQKKEEAKKEDNTK